MTAREQAADVDVAGQVERILREHGLNDNPGEYDSNIHSWRCEYPDLYGSCSCFGELRDDLTSTLRAALTDPTP